MFEDAPPCENWKDRYFVKGRVYRRIRTPESRIRSAWTERGCIRLYARANDLSGLLICVDMGKPKMKISKAEGGHKEEKKDKQAA
ncbi:hypothetical protein FNV43_RR00233 [Rhamnella rubrinervis]|uniref:Uncharacterized protein n=1 Tax=Rhamnella rubrinervis TaxID=2594499 RepID=A0A8K0MRQ5_9ROSA|nr:hypothetical protein FNV43_RR00233 [Rhamnella rubrinervis]